MIVCSCNVLSDDDVRNAVTLRSTFRATPSRSTAVSVAAPSVADARVPSDHHRRRSRCLPPSLLLGCPHSREMVADFLRVRIARARPKPSLEALA